MDNRERFEALVAKALASLPEEFRERLENVDVVVEERPTAEQKARAGLGRGADLLGLYEGIPLIKRGEGYNLTLPDRIIIFQKPIEARCHSESEAEAEIQRVLRHEIAHHFGSAEETLRQIEAGGKD